VLRPATGWEVGVLFPARGKKFFLHSVKTGSEAHLTSYPINTGGLLPWE
jgi:hypothetical protein